MAKRTKRTGQKTFEQAEREALVACEMLHVPVAVEEADRTLPWVVEARERNDAIRRRKHHFRADGLSWQETLAELTAFADSIPTPQADLLRLKQEEDA